MKIFEAATILEGADFANRFPIRIVGPLVKYVPSTVNLRSKFLGLFSTSFHSSVPNYLSISELPRDELLIPGAPNLEYLESMLSTVSTDNLSFCDFEFPNYEVMKEHASHAKCIARRPVIRNSGSFFDQFNPSNQHDFPANATITSYYDF